MNKAKDKVVIDYGFHVAICDLNEDALAEIPEMVKEGVMSFKCFLAYKGALMINDGALWDTGHDSRGKRGHHQHPCVGYD